MGQYGAGTHPNLHLVALHEALDALHQAMRIDGYCPSSMVIKIVVYSATFFYIIDHKIFNYSFMFTIWLLL
jgi:hypothetical protein